MSTPLVDDETYRPIKLLYIAVKIWSTTLYRDGVATKILRRQITMTAELFSKDSKPENLGWIKFVQTASELYQCLKACDFWWKLTNKVWSSKPKNWNYTWKFVMYGLSITWCDLRRSHRKSLWSHSSTKPDLWRNLVSYQRADALQTQDRIHTI